MRRTLTAVPEPETTLGEAGTGHMTTPALMRRRPTPGEPYLFGLLQDLQEGPVH